MKTALKGLLIYIHVGIKKLYNSEHENGLQFAVTKPIFTVSYFKLLITDKKVKDSVLSIFHDVEKKLQETSNNDKKIMKVIDDVYECLLKDNETNLLKNVIDGKSI